MPLGLPITTGFTSLINQCPDQVKTYLSKYLGEGINDIEKVTSTLENFINSRSFEDTILLTHLNNSSFQGVYEHYNNKKVECKSFLLKVKSGMYDLLAKFDKESSKTIYLNLLKQLKMKYDDARISIFTTNYDLTFENTVYNYKEEIKKLGISDIVYGFTPDFGTFAFNPLQEFKWENTYLEYIKLHGSLDWQSDENVICTKSGTCTKPADPNQSPLLYPGFKGIPNNQPFITFHERLVARLSEATDVFIIGFAFRDPYLNKLFEFFLRTSKANVYCFNPSDVKLLPEESAIRSFIQDFKRFKYIQKGIEISENPLDLSSIT